MIWFLNTNAPSPGAPFVASRTDTRPIPAPELVVGDVLDLQLFLIDGQGNYDPRSGTSSTTVRLALGQFGQPNVAYQATWTPISNGFSATLDLNSDAARALFDAQHPESVPLILEIEITDSLGNKQTICQAEIHFRWQLIGSSPSGPAPGQTYTPTSDLLKSFVQNRFAITGLTGGGANNLDGIPTAGNAQETGAMVAIVLNGTVYHYQLLNFTDPENAPFSIRPDDYGAGNSRVWRLVSQFGAATISGYTHTQSTPATTWTVTHNFGYRPAGIAVWVDHAGADTITDCEIVHVNDNSFQVKHDTNHTGIVRCI